MKRKTYIKIGHAAFVFLLPLIKIYTLRSRPRARILIIHDNHVLLVKNWFSGGHWALPGGGIDGHESPEAAIIREVKEELNIPLEPAAVAKIGLFTSAEKHGLKSKYYLFKADLIDRLPVTIPEREIVDFAWFPITEAATSKDVNTTVRDSLATWSGS